MPRATAPTTAPLDLEIGRPRAWSPRQPLAWSAAAVSQLDGERRAAFTEKVRWLRWEPRRGDDLIDLEVFEGLPPMAPGELAYGTAVSAYKGQQRFIGIAVGEGAATELRIYAPDEFGDMLLASKPLECELLNAVERALVVPPAPIARPGSLLRQPIAWPRFQPTQWMDAATKQQLAQDLVSFVDAGFPVTKFTGLVAKHLPNMYRLEPQHSGRLFCERYFATAADRQEFFEQVIWAQPRFGNGHERHTLSDVEYWVAEVLIDRGYLPAYATEAVRERDASARALYERLHEQFGSAPVVPVPAPKSNGRRAVPIAGQQALAFEL